MILHDGYAFSLANRSVVHEGVQRRLSCPGYRFNDLLREKATEYGARQHANIAAGSVHFRQAAEESQVLKGAKIPGAKNALNAAATATTTATIHTIVITTIITTTIIIIITAADIH